MTDADIDFSDVPELTDEQLDAMRPTDEVIPALAEHRRQRATAQSEREKALLSRIAVEPDVLARKPVIRGTRIPVELIIRLVAQDIPRSEILREYPQLKPEDIQAALLYAAAVLARSERLLVPTL